MTSLLLHSCCGPCATYTVEHWRGQGMEVTCFWFNPNIHPYQEHQRRLEAMQAFCQAVNLPLIIHPGYEMMSFLRLVAGKEGNRCPRCYRFRLSGTAMLARERGFDAFSTTLLISHHQKHREVKAAGEGAGEEVGVKFQYHDLRPGYVQSVKLSREHGLFRQQYCGCIYSEWERFAKVTILPPFTDSPP